MEVTAKQLDREDEEVVDPIPEVMLQDSIAMGHAKEVACVVWQRVEEAVCLASITTVQVDEATVLECYAHEALSASNDVAITEIDAEEDNDVVVISSNEEDE